MQTNPVQEPARPFSILPGFVHKSALWQGEGAPFPSQSSAEWALRRHRVQLKQVQALAMYRGRCMVHPERLSKVMESDALRAYE